MPTVAENLARVRDRVAAACHRAGRDPGGVTLVAVTKYASAEQVGAVLAAGVRDLGENRPQQLEERAGLYAASSPPVRWHQIGQVQRNKAKKVVAHAHLTHSADSERLLVVLDRAAADCGAPASVLLQINVSGEDSKSGFTPDAARDLWATDPAARFPHLRFRGLMTMAPAADDPDAARPTFAGLRTLRDELAGEDPSVLPELSMGMSGDFEPAIEEGATIVRVGSVLFGT